MSDGEGITTIVQSWQAYRPTTGAVEWSGSQFDGKIHVPIAESKAIDGVDNGDLCARDRPRLSCEPWGLAGMAARRDGTETVRGSVNSFDAVEYANPDAGQ